MSHPWLFSHAPSSMSTSSSSPTYPTTQREHSDHAPLQDHLASCAIKNHSGVKMCTVAPTGYEPQKLATISRIDAYSGGPYQFYDVHERFGEEDHQAPIPEETEEFAKFGTAGVPDSKLLETSCIQSQMHFDDSVESIADSDIEDGELQEMLTSPLYAQKASGKLDAMVMQERERGKCTIHSSRSKGKLRSHSSEGQKALGEPDALFSTEQGKMIRSSVFRNANPSNLKGSLLEGNKDHLLNQARSDLAKQELHVESLSISASVNYNDKRKRKDWHYRTRNTDLLKLDENELDYKKKCP